MSRHPTPTAILDEIIELSERATPGDIPSTHFHNCWRVHTRCAEVLAADLAREVKALRVAAGNVSIVTEFGAEYRRQISDEGYDPDHDDTHREGELACAAVAYAMPEWLNEWMDKNDIKIWPFEGHPKFKDRRRDLIRAGALLIAEIARLDREVAVALLPAEPAGSE